MLLIRQENTEDENYEEEMRRSGNEEFEVQLSDQEVQHDEARSEPISHHEISKYVYNTQYISYDLL